MQQPAKVGLFSGVEQCHKLGRATWCYKDEVFRPSTEMCESLYMFQIGYLNVNTEKEVRPMKFFAENNIYYQH